MQIRDFKLNKKLHWPKLILFISFFTLISLLTTNVWAVNGPCDKCHTMHNSQNGTNQIHVGGAWSAQSGGAITGGTSTPPGELLVSDCVGCHSLVGSANVTVNDGYNLIPIVYNTGGYPGTTLAGGNFNGVAGNQTFGHNVRGISSDDSIHSEAPGMITAQGCNNSCHTDLTLLDAATTPTPGGITTNGCRGCHLELSHHDNSNTAYRGLGGHGGVVGTVLGRGDNNPAPSGDWEATKSATDHNVYVRDEPSDGTDLQPVSIGRWCAGCHSEFHAWGTDDINFGNPNGGDDNTDNLISANSIGVTAGASAWLRHPTNVNIPNDPAGEYAALLIGSPYNPNIPVAQDLLSNTNSVEAGDQVFCLSCHRAHGSDQPDALRFDYSVMLSHSGTASINPDGDLWANGCFYCHTTKANP